MRALVLVAALSSCGGSSSNVPDGFLPPECFPVTTATCTLWISIPEEPLPFLWTCTTGNPDAATLRPDHRPCVLCVPRQAEWCEAGTGACVSSCTTCTPAAALIFDPYARCSAETLGNYVPRDGFTVFGGS